MSYQRLCKEEVSDALQTSKTAFPSALPRSAPRQVCTQMDVSPDCALEWFREAGGAPGKEISLPRLLHDPPKIVNDDEWSPKTTCDAPIERSAQSSFFRSSRIDLQG